MFSHSEYHLYDVITSPHTFPVSQFHPTERFLSANKMPVKGLSEVPADIRLESLPDPGNRFTLGAVIGSGISGTVYEAVDTQAGLFSVSVV